MFRIERGNMKPKAVYKIALGLKEQPENWLLNWDSVNVVACDVADACKKVKLKRGEYIVSVIRKAEIDIE